MGRFGVWAGLVYCATILSTPWWAVAVLLGAGLGASLERRAALAVAGLAWLVGLAVGPPAWVLFETFFFEPSYLRALGQVQPEPLGLALAPAVAALPWGRLGAARVARGLLVLVVVGYLSLAPGLGQRTWLLLQREPPDRSYYFDGLMLLKAHHLMRQGAGYYEASRQAFERDSREYQPGYPSQSLRPPYLFWAWSLLPDPGGIAVLAWLLTAWAMLAMGWARHSDEDPILGLLGPLLLGAWSLFFLSNPFIMFADYWGGLLMLLGLACLRRNRVGPAATLLLLALLVREFCGLPLLLLGLRETWQRRRRAWLWLSLLMIGGLAYAVHEHFLRTVLGMHTQSTASGRLQGSLTLALATLRFGSVFLLGRDLLMPLLALANLACPDRILAGTGLAMLGLWCFLGNPGFTQFYAMDFVPLLLWGASLALARQPGGPLQAGLRANGEL